MQRITNAKKSLKGDGNSHEDGSTKTDVGDGIYDKGEADTVSITADFKCFESVVDSSNDDVDGIKTRQSYQELMKTILKFWFGQNID